MSGAVESVKPKRNPGPPGAHPQKPLLDADLRPLWDNVEERWIRANRLQRDVYNALRTAVMGGGKSGFADTLEQLKTAQSDLETAESQRVALHDELMESCGNVKRLNEANSKMMAQIRDTGSRMAVVLEHNEAISNELKSKAAELSGVRQRLAKELETKASDMFYAAAKRSLTEVEAAFHETWALIGGEAKWDPSNVLDSFRVALRALGDKLMANREPDKDLAERVKRLETERDEVMNIACELEGKLAKANDALFEERKARMVEAVK